MKLLTTDTKYTINKKIYKGSDILNKINELIAQVNHSSIKLFTQNTLLNSISNKTNTDIQISHTAGKEIAKLLSKDESILDYIINLLIEQNVFTKFNSVLDLPKTLLLQDSIDLNKWINNVNRMTIDGPRLELLYTYPNGDLFYNLSLFYNKGENQIINREDLELFYNMNIEVLKSIGFECSIDEHRREGLSETLIKYGILIKNK